MNRNFNRYYTYEQVKGFLGLMLSLLNFQPTMNLRLKPRYDMWLINICYVGYNHTVNKQMLFLWNKLQDMIYLNI